MRKRTMKGLASVAAWGAVLLGVCAAGASPTYPAAIKDDLKTLNAADMPCTPPCTICHRDALGGRGTVIKPFGLAMIENGLVFQDTDALARALAALKASGVDSDGDGVTDIDELSAGHDPNVSGPAALCVSLPRYGCGASVAPDRPAGAGAFLFGLLAWLVARRGGR
jgi:hypothetical protein